jgi:hypothetical protein
MRLADIFPKLNENTGYFRPNVTFDDDVPIQYVHIIEQHVVRVAQILAPYGLQKLAKTLVYIYDVNASGMATNDHIAIGYDASYGAEHYVETIIHELGHVFDLRAKHAGIQQDIMAMYNQARSYPSLFPSEYSKTNFQEYWAECFAGYFLGTLSSTLSSWVGDMIEEYKSYI